MSRKSSQANQRPQLVALLCRAVRPRRRTVGAVQQAHPIKVNVGRIVANTRLESNRPRPLLLPFLLRLVLLLLMLPQWRRLRRPRLRLLQLLLLHLPLGLRLVLLAAALAFSTLAVALRATITPATCAAVNASGTAGLLAAAVFAHHVERATGPSSCQQSQ